MKQISYRQLGSNRGSPRLWLQGLKLREAGYEIGNRYSLKADRNGQTLVLKLEANGERRVSRKKRGDRLDPVIDVENGVLAEIFGGAERVKVVIQVGSITVSLHPDEAERHERVERLREKVRRRRPLAIGSLSHGLGVLDHAVHQGLDDAGIASRLAFAVDCELAYLQASVDNNPIWDEESIAVHARMEEVDPRELGKVDLLLAGLPCTGASRSGKAKNGLQFAEQHETAATPFLAFLAIMKACNPSIAVLENVVDYQKTVSMQLIRAALCQSGYTVHEAIVDRDLGAFEERKRLCVVAVTEGMEFNLALEAVRQREQTLGDVLEAIPEEAPNWRRCAYLDEKEKRDIAAGKGFRTQLVDSQATKVGTIGRGYAKWRSSEPMVSHPSRPGYRRLLTPVEHARVKAVPERLIKGLSATLAHQCLGQAVLHPVFVAVGRCLGLHVNQVAQS